MERAVSVGLGVGESCIAPTAEGMNADFSIMIKFMAKLAAPPGPRTATINGPAAFRGWETGWMPESFLTSGGPRG
jgi:hypothetical protein